jgi:hypothetical protein
MTDIEAKALALVNEVRVERGWEPLPILYRTNYEAEALYRAIERHETYKQKVSDAIENEWANLHYGAKKNFSIFIIDIPKPDPLVEVLDALKDGRAAPTTESYAAFLRAALEARGLEIREKKQ